MKGQPGFFDLAERHDKLTEMRGPLVVPKKEIDREAFRGDLAKVHEKERKSAAGAKPRDGVRMFKVLILQQTCNLSDEQIEYPIRDRLSFMRFLGLPMEDKVPDEKTVGLFREHSAEHKLTDALFARCHEPLAGRGFAAQGGQMSMPPLWKSRGAATAARRTNQSRPEGRPKTGMTSCPRKAGRMSMRAGRKRAMKATQATRITSTSTTNTSGCKAAR